MRKMVELVVLLLGSTIVALGVCLYLAGIAASGVITMELTHTLFWATLVVLVLGAALSAWVMNLGRRAIWGSAVITLIVVATILWATNAYLTKKKAELDAANQPPPQFHKIIPGPSVPIVKTPRPKPSRVNIDQRGNDNVAGTVDQSGNKGGTNNAAIGNGNDVGNTYNINPPKPPDPIGLFLDCDFQRFPITIPSGSKILVLQVRPDIIKKNIGLEEISAPDTGTLIWPSEKDDPPLAIYTHPNQDNPIKFVEFYGVKCTLRKIGASTSFDAVVLPIIFGEGWGTYKLITDPLENSGLFSEFTFYMVNYCYSEPQMFGDIPSGLMVGYFAPTATVHVLGESDPKQVAIRIPFRNKLQPNFLLQGSYRRWSGFSPC